MNIVIKGVPKEGSYLLSYQDTTEGVRIVILNGANPADIYLGEVRDFVPKYRPLIRRIGDKLSDAIDYIDTAIDDWTHFLRRKYARVKHKKRLIKGRRNRNDRND